MNKKTRKLFTWCLVLAMLVTQMLFANVAFASTKLSGTDRYQTALQVVKAGWTTSENAVIARGDDLADALAAAPLAYAKGKAPILLTETNALPTGVMEELTALGVKTVYIVGGTGAVSTAVENALAAKFTVKRIFGADRYATSLAIAKEAFPTAPAKAVMVNGEAYADALSISGIAAYNGMPILLVGKDTMTADVQAYLTGKTVYAVGGEGVISAANAGNATRLSGADRYATNVAVLKAFTLDWTKVYVAVGEDANAVDALGGAALAALGNNPIILVNGALTAEAKALLADNVKADTKVFTLGGVVPASVATQIEDIINGLELSVKSVSVVNSKDLAVTFNRNVDEISAETPANYTIKVNNATVDSNDYTVALDSNDASKVAITLDNHLANGDIVKVTVKKAIMDEDLKAMSADYTTTLPAFSDTTAPSIVSAKVDGNNVVVTFDDYIAETTSTIAKLDGVAYSYTINGKKLTLTGANNPALDEGTHKVAIFAIADLLDNLSTGLTKTFTITEDTTEPAFKSIEAKSTYGFQIAFNKELAADPTVTAKKNGYSVNVTSVTVNADDSTLYDVTVADGTVPVYDDDQNSATLTVTISNIKDADDNYGAPVTKTVTLTKDTVAPKVDLRNTKVSGNNMLIQFSEELSPTSVDESKIIITDEDGVRVPATAYSCTVENDARFGDGTVLQIAFTTLDAGKYTVVLQAGVVTDLSDNDSVATTVTLTKSAGTTDEDFDLGSATAADNVITVDFNGHDMTASATNVNNYLLDNEKLPTGTIAYFLGDKSHVVIELPAASVVATDDYLLTLSKSVVDEDGLYVSDATRNQLVGLVDNVKPVLVSAKKVDSTTVELTFSEAMADPTAVAAALDDFVVKVNGADVTVSAIAVGDSGKKLELTVGGYNVNQTVTVTVGGTGITLNVTDVQGNLVTKGTTVTATK